MIVQTATDGKMGTQVDTGHVGHVGRAVGFERESVTVALQAAETEPPVELEHAVGYTGACSSSLFLHPNGTPTADL